jgi:hypothetical protein
MEERIITLINRHTWKWTKELFIKLFDLTIQYNYILFSTCAGKKILHRDFRLTLVMNLLAQAGQDWNVLKIPESGEY